jgi:hypothetical protein
MLLRKMMLVGGREESFDLWEQGKGGIALNVITFHDAVLAGSEPHLLHAQSSLKRERKREREKERRKKSGGQSEREREKEKQFFSAFSVVESQMKLLFFLSFFSSFFLPLSSN